MFVHVYFFQLHPYSKQTFFQKFFLLVIIGSLPIKNVTCMCIMLRPQPPFEPLDGFETGRSASFEVGYTLYGMKFYTMAACTFYQFIRTELGNNMVFFLNNVAKCLNNWHISLPVMKQTSTTLVSTQPVSESANKLTVTIPHRYPQAGFKAINPFRAGFEAIYSPGFEVGHYLSLVMNQASSL